VNSVRNNGPQLVDPAPQPVRSTLGRLSPAHGFQCVKRGRGAALEEVNGAGAGKVQGRRDHPDGEVDSSMSVNAFVLLLLRR
jgi:hypothetical protein